MYFDNREYSRIKMDKACVIYAPDEIECIIKDISESGICFETDKNLDIGEIITFTFIDELNFANFHKDYVIIEKAKVIRNNKNQYGCKLMINYNNELYKYVVNKKLNKELKEKKLI